MEVSRFYMQYFNFDNYKLDDAVRVFVERAPLIGTVLFSDSSSFTFLFGFYCYKGKSFVEIAVSNHWCSKLTIFSYSLTFKK